MSLKIIPLPSGAFPFLGKYQRESNLTLKSPRVHENDVTESVGKRSLRTAKYK